MPRSPTRRHRRSLPFLAVALAGAALLPSVGLGQSPSMGPDPSAAAPGVALPSRWVRASVPDASPGAGFAAVAAGQAGFVAVGGGFPEGAQRPRVEIRTSPDGVRWTRAALQGPARFGQARAVVATADGGYLVVGGRCCPDQAMVWRSADGVTWEVLPDADVLAGAAILGVTQARDGGFVAVGCQAVMECGAGLAWRSADGVTWEEPVAMPLLPFDVVDTDIGLVAVGTTEPYQGAPAVAISPDGITWAPVPIDGIPVGMLLAAESVPGGALLAGSSSDPDSMLVTGLVMLLTVDGAAIQDTITVPDHTFEDLAWLGDDPADGLAGLVLVGWALGEDDQVPATWSSTDGETWEPGSFARELKGTGTLHGLAIGSDGTAVIVGSSVLNVGLVPGAWVSAPAAPAP